MIRIRSEHAIGYLKGRFHSLKNLRVHITSRRRHIIATYWIAACVGLHSLAIKYEQRERAAVIDDDEWTDPFIAEGLDDEDGLLERGMPPQSRASATRLEAARACREKLKQRLLRFKAARQQSRIANRREQILTGLM
ncbi:hypothetical protein BDN70DRAFT_826181 [Pholiota conissans]|uniref:DDE Tnp4 domain-containing protein n=1 Tax=Pholiota conissans TaxID=109636 RepID=A0A9P6D5Q1_9AGAR|nr:hypothetical protein BDN70DRAFT_826181 [Pholiota conissans]